MNKNIINLHRETKMKLKKQFNIHTIPVKEKSLSSKAQNTPSFTGVRETKIVSRREISNFEAKLSSFLVLQKALQFHGGGIHIYVKTRETTLVLCSNFECN